MDEMQRIITSRKRVSIRKDQGWYSESEMKTDLKWTTNLGFKETCAIQKKLSIIVTVHFFKDFTVHREI